MITAHDILQKDYETVLHYLTVQENIRREEQTVGRGGYGVSWELYRDGNDQITSDKFKLENVSDEQSLERKLLSMVVRGRREKNPLLVILGYHLYNLREKTNIDEMCRNIYERGVTSAAKSEKVKPVREFLQMIMSLKSPVTDQKSLAVNLYRAFKETEEALK
jgi:Cu2+-containing amine oxidase